MIGPFWTDERIARMRELLAKGISAGAVAREIGCSRNAVIGKVHRIEAATREVWIRTHGFKTGPRKAPRKQTAKAVPEKVQTVPKPKFSIGPSLARSDGGFRMPLRAVRPRVHASPPPSSAKVGILDVTGCKWPVGIDPKVIGGHVFCNAEKHDERYCQHHVAVSDGSLSKAQLGGQPAKKKVAA